MLWSTIKDFCHSFIIDKVFFMVEIRFYHLTRRPLETALPEILSKAYKRGTRCIVRTENEKETGRLNELLWTFNPNSFLPHGSKKDKNEDMQPIWLTDSQDNPNGADTLFVTGKASDAKLEDYKLCCLLFDGNNEEMLTLARQRWKKYSECGHDLAYWQQTEQGWQKKQ